MSLFKFSSMFYYRNLTRAQIMAFTTLLCKVNKSGKQTSMKPELQSEIFSAEEIMNFLWYLSVFMAKFIGSVQQGVPNKLL